MIIADLHIHSKHSRATSKNLSFENLVKYARIKGINVLGTGDFTHPIWFEEIKKMNEKDGLYYYDNFPFVISGEISLMYTQGRGRRVHLVLLVPNVEVAEKINSYLDTQGRRDYDGRPIFKIPCQKFVRELMDISKDIEIIPAHIWTPWFGLLGSKSGFDSLKEAFGEQIENIHAIETGLSSDPPMNWKIKELDNISIVSFSDSHSFWPWRLGREATLFDLDKTELSYNNLINAIRENKIAGTIEVDPAYGMYHWDGHRNCDFSCSPAKTKELNGICPVCNDKLIIGVENRVNDLTHSERISNFKKENGKNFYKILPLHEIISLFSGVGIASKGNWKIYNELIDKFGNEFNILLNVSKDNLLAEDVNEKLVDLILKNREGKIKVKPGFDGKYGEAVLVEQKKLFL